MKQKDNDNQSFVTDSFSHILNLERTFFENDDKDFIHMLWAKCMPKELLDFISQDYYFKLLYNLTFKYGTANDILLNSSRWRILTI